MIQNFIRPIAQTLFPDIVGQEDAIDHFAFTVQYNTSQDVALSEHRDASVVTFNLNLNAVEDFSRGGLEGSKLYFIDEKDKSIRNEVEIKPGEALIHRGSLRHAALPLTGSGQRQNLIIWMFGEDGYVREAKYPEEDQMSPQQRWGVIMDSTTTTRAGPYHGYVGL